MGLEPPQILVPMVGPGTNPPQITRNKCINVVTYWCYIINTKTLN